MMDRESPIGDPLSIIRDPYNVSLYVIVYVPFVLLLFFLLFYPYNPPSFQEAIVLGAKPPLTPQ